MDSDTSRMTGSLLLLLSLLIHILLLLFFFLFQSPTHEGKNQEYSLTDDQTFQDQAAQPQNQQQQQDDDYGDHEIMIELLPQGINPNDTMVDDPGALTAASAQSNAEEPTEQDPSAQESSDQEDPSTKEDEQSQENDAGQEEQPTPTTPLPQEPMQQVQSLSDAVSHLQALAQAQQQKQIPQQPTPKKTVRAVHKLAQRPPVPPNEARILSKITQGFIQSMGAELGMQPSNDPKQLAHQRYMTKLWNSLKQAVNAEENVLILNSHLDTHGTLVLTINKEGKLLNALLRHSRKTPDLLKMENMLLTNAQKVGLFPPLPDSFGKNEVTFSMPIHLRAQQGMHSGYRLQVEQ